MTRIATTHRRRTRPGFTIVELLVAAAVCVLIMAILATCFQTGIDTFRQLKAQGDLTDQLRAAEIVIRRDLQAKRFLPEDDKENLGVRVSDLRYDQLTLNAAGTALVPVTGFQYAIRPPRGGFMRIVCPDASAGAGSVYEGTDQDGNDASRATAHLMHFTSVLPGGIDQNVYSATVAGVVPVTPTNPRGEALFTSPAAEIALFLDTAAGPVGFAGNVPLYNLVRRQRLVAVNESDAFGYPSGDAGVISVRQVGAGWRVNTMTDLTNPNNRLTGPAGGIATTTPQPRGTDAFLAPLGGNRIGDDVLLSNVISFEVKVSWTPATYNIAARGLPRPPNTSPPWIAPRAYAPPGAPSPDPRFPYNDNDNDGLLDANSDHPFDYLPGRVPGVPTGSNNLTGGFNQVLNAAPNGRFVYDSWTTATANWNVAAMNGASVAPHPEALPMRVRVTAVQIRLRVFDPKMKNARQMTIVQDL